MKDTVFLIFDRKGFVRANKNRTDLKLGEVGVDVSVEIAAPLFERPTLRATLKVDSDAVPRFEVTPEVLSNITQSVKIGTGLDLKVEVEEGTSK